MKVKVEDKKGLVFLILIAVLVGVLVGAYLVNLRKASSDKTYMDSMKQKLEVETITTDEKLQNEVLARRIMIPENALGNEVEVYNGPVDLVENSVEGALTD